MPPITWDQVAAFDPALAAIPLTTQTIILMMVASQVDPDSWGEKYATGAILLAAHIAVMSSNGGRGTVSSEAVGQLSQSYATNAAQLKSDLGLTSYGTMFERLLWSLPNALGAVP